MLKKFVLEKKNYKFKYISLFSGIGGFEKGLDALGGECLFSSEIDRHAQKTYKVLHPEHTLESDITKVDEKDIPAHDMIVGGFPCQAFSVAGKKLAFADDRGQLYLEIVRIAKHHQPKVLFLENVKGLLSAEKGEVFKTIVKSFNEIGYTIFHKVLNSKNFQLPQSRERIMIIGIRNDLLKEDINYEELLFTFPEYEKVRLLDIMDKEVDEKHYVTIDKMDTYKKGSNAKRDKDLIFVGGFGKLWRETTGPYYSGNFSQGNRVYDAKGISTTLTAQHIGGLGKKTTVYLVPDEYALRDMNIRSLTIQECFQVQGFTKEDANKALEDGALESQLYKQIGNAVSVNVIYSVMTNILKLNYFKEEK